MGKEYYCDGCGKSVPIDTSLNKITIGEQEVAELCFDCTGALKTGMMQQKLAAEKQRKSVASEVTQDEIPGQAPVAPDPQPTAPPQPSAQSLIDEAHGAVVQPPNNSPP